MLQSFSFSQIAWKRLKKNKGAMFGLLIIIISVFTGLFAYFIAEDSTPNADRQIVEIPAKKPGYEQLFLKLKKEKDIPKTGFFKRLIYGAEDQFTLIPITSYQAKKDSIIIQKYIDEGVEEQTNIPLEKTYSKNFIVSKTF